MARGQLIITLIGYIFGTGGLLAFLVQFLTLRKDNKKDTVNTWQQLYNTVQENSNKYEEENKKLRDEIDDLHTKVLSLTVELQGYKHFERYVAELEVYSSSLLSVIEPLVSTAAFQKLKSAKPVRMTVTMNDIISTNSKQAEPQKQEKEE